MLIHLVWAFIALPVVFSSIQEANWKRSKRQQHSCSCVSEYTPVNCKCQAANGPGGELLCRCDRAAVLSHPVCANCPHTTNNHMQSTQQPGPPIYTPPPSQSASYVAAMCQPICRQNCVQTCNAAKNYHQVPFTATGQHHFGTYSAHQSNTPQCHPSQCQYTCKRACSQVPSNQALPLATHISAFGSYPSSPIPNPSLFGATAVCSCPAEEDFCTCQQCVPMCADSCELGCQQQREMSPTLMLTSMVQAEPVQLIEQCIPVCRQNCIRACEDDDVKSKRGYGVEHPQPAPLPPTTTPKLNTEKSNLADCFVRCPHSCQRACNNLQGSTIDNCQPACQSMCAQSCRQHEENVHKRKLHSPMQEERVVAPPVISELSSTSITTALPEDTTPASPSPPLPISMDEPAACAPLCQPNCLKSCTSRYLEPQASAIVPNNDQSTIAASRPKQITLHDLPVVSSEKMGSASDANSSNLLNHLKQRTAMIESVGKTLASLAQLRQQAFQQRQKLATPPTPQLIEDPEASSSEVYMVSQYPTQALLLQPRTGYLFPSVNEKRQNVGFVDEFLMRRKFNKLQHHQQSEAEKSNLKSFRKSLHHPVNLNESSMQQDVLHMENTKSTTPAFTITSATQEAIIDENVNQPEKEEQNKTLVEPSTAVNTTVEIIQLTMTTTFSPLENAATEELARYASSTAMVANFRNMSYVQHPTPPTTTYPQTLQTAEDDKNVTIGIDNSKESHSITENSTSSIATLKIIGRRAISNSFANIFHNRSHQ